MERSEEALRPELEDNFEHLLESNGGSKVKSLSIQQYENCTRYKDWLRLREEDEGAYCYLDDDALEAKWTAYVSFRFRHLIPLLIISLYFGFRKRLVYYLPGTEESLPTEIHSPTYHTFGENGFMG